MVPPSGKSKSKTSEDKKVKSAQLRKTAGEAALMNRHKQQQKPQHQETRIQQQQQQQQPQPPQLQQRSSARLQAALIPNTEPFLQSPVALYHAPPPFYDIFNVPARDGRFIYLIPNTTPAGTSGNAAVTSNNLQAASLHQQRQPHQRQHVALMLPHPSPPTGLLDSNNILASLAAVIPGSGGSSGATSGSHAQLYGIGSLRPSTKDTSVSAAGVTRRHHHGDKNGVIDLTEFDEDEEEQPPTQKKQQTLLEIHSRGSPHKSHHNHASNGDDPESLDRKRKGTTRNPNDAEGSIDRVGNKKIKTCEASKSAKYIFDTSSFKESRKSLEVPKIVLPNPRSQRRHSNSSSSGDASTSASHNEEIELRPKEEQNAQNINAAAASMAATLQSRREAKYDETYQHHQHLTPTSTMTYTNKNKRQLKKNKIGCGTNDVRYKDRINELVRNLLGQSSSSRLTIRILPDELPLLSNRIQDIFKIADQKRALETSAPKKFKDIKERQGLQSHEAEKEVLLIKELQQQLKAQSNEIADQTNIIKNMKKEEQNYSSIRKAWHGKDFSTTVKMQEDEIVQLKKQIKEYERKIQQNMNNAAVTATITSGRNDNDEIKALKREILELRNDLIQVKVRNERGIHFYIRASIRALESLRDERINDTNTRLP